VEVDLDSLRERDLKTDKTLFFSVDNAMLARQQESGQTSGPPPMLLDFAKLLKKTGFAAVIQKMLQTLERVYEYPVDVEFTANFTHEGNFRLNLLQCRPLQTKGLGKAVAMPKQGEVFIASAGSFMGGNARLPLEYVVFVRAREYLELDERGKYQVARLVGMLNQKLKPHSAALVGPGRWGTTTPSLGVPVHFSELSNMTALCEVSYQQGGLMPELSFGSHFFLDIVEAGIFYVAVFVGKEGVEFRPEYILGKENEFGKFLENESEWGRVIHVARTEELFLFSDITTQRVKICVA
jgi:hypothetical protein